VSAPEDQRVLEVSFSLGYVSSVLENSARRDVNKNRNNFGK